MRTLAVLISVAASCALGNTARADGPFGVTMGDQISNLPGCVMDGEFYATCRDVPKKHPAMATYGVQITPQHGVCSISAASSDTDNSPTGFSLQAGMDEIASQLSSVYGQPKKYDFILPSSIWLERKYWMMSILKEDRVYSYIWKKELGSKLKNSVSAIVVRPLVTSMDRGYYLIRYEFANYGSCQDFIKKHNAGSL